MSARRAGASCRIASVTRRMVVGMAAVAVIVQAAAAAAPPSPTAGSGAPAVVLAAAAAAAMKPAAPYNQTVNGRIQPQSRELLVQLAGQGRQLSLDGVPVFNGDDKFLPGK